MKIRHPFEWLSDSYQSRAFGLLFVLTIAVMLTLQISGGTLKTDAAPAGIVSYEFAGSLPVAQKIIESWGATGRVYAGLNLGFDYLFLVIYPLAIGLGCVIVARAGFLSTLGILLAWEQLLAGILDAIENYALIQLLLGAREASLPIIAQWCATLKFAIVGLGLAYFLIGGAVKLVSKKG